MTDPATLRRLAEAATPGPWYHGPYYAVVTADVPQDVDHAIYRGFKEPEHDGRYLLCESVAHPPTRAYIAAANPQAAIALLDRLDRQSALCAAMAQWLANQQHWTDLPDDHVVLESRGTEGEFRITAGMIREANR